ncbi:TolC family protein [Pleomorphovibrio marinus]|uniref:TolC family protein n=1 Tax=Pleomorphovibrio marinus TaxID=2164132 RepID=UPI000E0A211F|nr:TolC family protein [Pleomorphovibrio marinus]
MLRLFVFSFFMLVFFEKSWAQEEINRIDGFNLNLGIERQLPTLDSLIEMSLSYHPTIKLNEALIGSAESRVKIEKKSWSNLVRGYFDYGYGNQAIVATGSQATDLSNIANGYRAGANVSIPLSEIFTRKDRIRYQEQELLATYHKTQEMELVIANQVIEQYNNLLLAQKLINIRFEMQQKAKNNLVQLELEYVSGDIEGTSYVRNAEIYAIAQSEYENARANFMVASQKLEVLLGRPLSEIRRKP